MVDASGSIQDADPGNWQLIKNFLIQVVDRLDIGEDKTRVGLVKFSNRGNVEFRLDEFYNKDALNVRINDMKFSGGNTNTSGGIITLLQQVFVEEAGDRKDVADTIIVLTDGKSTKDVDKTVPYATMAKDRNIRILVIGITEQIDEQELEDIASDPADMGMERTVFKVTDFSDLQNILGELAETTCVTLTTTSTTTTTTVVPPSECTNTVDVVVMLDASGSVEAGNFNEVRTINVQAWSAWTLIYDTTCGLW